MTRTQEQTLELQSQLDYECRQRKELEKSKIETLERLEIQANLIETLTKAEQDKLSEN